VKRFSRFRHAALHMDSAYCWNVSVFYFVYCETADKTISSTRNRVLLPFMSVIFQLCGHHKTLGKINFSVWICSVEDIATCSYFDGVLVTWSHRQVNTIDRVCLIMTKINGSLGW